jgi:hypothetical protein
MKPETEISLESGQPFAMDNTTSGELLVSIATALGSVIHVSLPPGGSVRIEPALEKLIVDAKPGAQPGIHPAC